MAKNPKSIPDRKIDTWYYDVKDLTVPIDEDGEAEDPDELENTGASPAGSKVITKKVEVSLYLVKDTAASDTPPYPLKEASFRVVCKEPNFDFHGTDIESLRAAAWASLDKKYEVQWNAYYLVTVDHAHGYSGVSTGLTFSYNTVYKGITWDGKLLLKDYDSFHRHAVIKPWPGAFTDKGGKAIACIPHSETNEAALEEFAKRVNKLRELMKDYLRPDRIADTLANLSGLALLPPAPEPTEESHGQS